MMRDAVDAIRQKMDTHTIRQLSQAMYSNSGGSRGNYLTTNNSSAQFGPVYINHKMDEAEFLHRVQKIMDQRRPL